MSNEETHVSILLPGSRVLLFTKDQETRQTFLSLEQDWRFARVALETLEGDVDTAIGKFRNEASPDLVIIQTDTIDDGFIQKLEDLGASCAEGTSAIIIGPDNDVNLYRRLVGMGVSDYLVRPVPKEPFSNDIAQTLINKFGATGSRLIALMGAKGGVGTTMLTEILAWGLSDMLGQKTFLMDASGGWSTLSVGINFEPTTTLPEAVRAASENNKDSLSRMLHTASDKLTVLSSGGDVMLDDPASADNYEVLLNMMMTTYPVTVVDLSASPAALRRTVLARAHEIMLVTAPTLSSVRATRTLMQEIKEIRGGSADAVDVIVNMAGAAPKHEVPKGQIEEGLGCKVAATIPYAADLFASLESRAKKHTDDKEGKSIAQKLLPLVKKILTNTGSDTPDAANDTTDKKGGLGGFLTKLKTK